jgi:hypothetical protein
VIAAPPHAHWFTERHEHAAEDSGSDQQPDNPSEDVGRRLSVVTTGEISN